MADAPTMLTKLREAMREPAVRIELEKVWSLNSKGLVDVAKIYVKNERNRWVQVGPFLTPGEDEGRSDLVKTIASLAGDE